MAATFDDRRPFRPIATGWGRAELSLIFLEDCCVSRASVTRGHPSTLDRGRLSNADAGGLDPKRKSVREIAQTVRYGRKVTFLVFDGDPIEGYVAGMDEDYFYVLAPNADGKGFRRWYINRAGNPAFELHAESTYGNEPQREAMDVIIAPFRGWVSSHVLGNGRDTETRKAG